MSDTDRLYRLLKREGSRGVHTHDLRSNGVSGNPSQRATEVEVKYGVKLERPTEFRNGRNGSRYKLVGVGAGGTSSGAPSPSVDSGEQQVGGSRSPGASPARRPAPVPLFPDPPSAYDPFSEAA